MPHVVFQRALSASPNRVGVAATLSAGALDRVGVRHLLCGGLAVAAHGYARATTDVDFLVGDEAFDSHGALVTMKAGIPFDVGGVKIDLITMPEVQGWIEEELDTNTTGVVSVELLIVMKLGVYRPKDRLDVIELLRVDADRAEAVRARYSLPSEYARRLAVCEREALK